LISQDILEIGFTLRRVFSNLILLRIQVLLHYSLCESQGIWWNAPSVFEMIEETY